MRVFLFTISSTSSSTVWISDAERRRSTHEDKKRIEVLELKNNPFGVEKLEAKAGERKKYATLK